MSSCSVKYVVVGVERDQVVADEPVVVVDARRACSGCVARSSRTARASSSPTDQPFSSATVRVHHDVSGCDRSARLALRQIDRATCVERGGLDRRHERRRPVIRNPAWRNSETAATSGSARTLFAASVQNGVNGAGREHEVGLAASRSSAASNDALSERREDRDHRDQPEPDHQRGRGRGGPARVPHRVLAAELPGIESRWSGAPIAPATGRANSGDSIATPMKVTAAPSPTSAPAFEARRTGRRASAADAERRDDDAHDQRRRTWPRTARCRRIPAAPGSARRGRPCAPGRTTATTVTTEPDDERDDDRAGQQLERRARQVDPERAEQRLRGRAAIPIPATIPTTEANRPTRSASTTTDVITCAGEAPSARSSASSRVRWATMIENVLKMMNAPDEQRDEREHEQRDPEEPEPLLQRLWTARRPRSPT